MPDAVPPLDGYRADAHQSPPTNPRHGGWLSATPPEAEFSPQRSQSWRGRVRPACAGVQGHRNKRRTAVMGVLDGPGSGCAFCCSTLLEGSSATPARPSCVAPRRSHEPSPARPTTQLLCRQTGQPGDFAIKLSQVPISRSVFFGHRWRRDQRTARQSAGEPKRRGVGFS